MKILLTFCLLYITTQLWGQTQSPKLDSFDKLRQTVLLQFIRQAGGADSLGLRDERVYYTFYFEGTPLVDTSKRTKESRLADLHRFTEVTVGSAKKYCACQSVNDIQALPVRFFRQSHPVLYQAATQNTYFGEAIHSTSFFVYCPSKKKKGSNEVIALALFGLSAKLGYITSMRPSPH